MALTLRGTLTQVRASQPAEEIYAGSIVEFFILLFATLLGLLTYVVPPRYAFSFFAGPALRATIALFACARFEALGAPPMREGLLS